jgi:hypothetical protein
VATYQETGCGRDGGYKGNGKDGGYKGKGFGKDGGYKVGGTEKRGAFQGHCHWCGEWVILNHDANRSTPTWRE